MKLCPSHYAPFAFFSIVGLFLGLAPATSAQTVVQTAERLAQTEEDLSPPESDDIFANIPVVGERCPIFPSQNLLELPTEPEEVSVQRNRLLTLDETVDCVLFNSPELDAAYAILGEAQQAWIVARSAYYPDVSVELRADFINPDGDLVSDLEFRGGPAVNYDILTFGRRTSQLRTAEANLRVAELGVGRVSESLQREATIAYYNLQEANRNVNIRQVALTEAEEILRITEGVVVNVSSPLNQARAELLLSNSQRSLELSVRNQKITHSRLAALLAVEEDERVVATDSIQLAPQWEMPIEESIIQAYQNRPDLNQLLALRELSNQERRGILATLMPLLSVQAGYANNTFTLPSFDIRSDTPQVTLDFSWQPFDVGGGTRARAAQERQQMEAIEADFAAFRYNLRAELEEAYYNLESAAHNITRTARAEELAEIALGIAKGGASEYGQLDLLDAQVAYTEARLAATSTLLDYNRSIADLKFAIGGLGLFPALPTAFPNREYPLFDVTPPAIEPPNAQEESN